MARSKFTLINHVCRHVLLLEFGCKMSNPLEYDLSSAGAFIDTSGDRNMKGKKTVQEKTREDIEEEELEALVFGKQPFKVAEDPSTEEVTDVMYMHVLTLPFNPSSPCLATFRVVVRQVLLTSPSP